MNRRSILTTGMKALGAIGLAGIFKSVPASDSVNVEAANFSAVTLKNWGAAPMTLNSFRRAIGKDANADGDIIFVPRLRSPISSDALRQIAGE